MKTLSKIFLMTLILISSSTVAAEEEIGVRDSTIIFGTGVAVQVGAVGLITYGPPGTEPVAAIAFIGTGVMMDIVGDSLGHNGNMFWTAAATYLGSLAGGAIGWAGANSVGNSQAENFALHAAVFSMGPLFGTLAYRWSNEPKQELTVRLTPTVLETPSQTRISGLGLSGTF